MMWISCVLFICSLLPGIWAQSSAINVADLPQCARNCLTNSTSVVAATCTSLNVACLCNSPEFVSAFYCCLSTQCKTSEQATAIQFNQQQCAAVNATAPDFVGCSPLKATSSGGGITAVTTVTPSNGGAFSTVASIITEPGSPSVTNQVTATYSGRSLLTGSCTVPLFALASNSAEVRLFPETGCASSREDCCPFDTDTNGILTTCPQDYFTTANGCCPLGYQVYTTAIGSETPCYSVPSAIFVPATTPSIAGLTVVTDRVFSRKYPLVVTKTKGLSGGAVAGIIVGSIVSTSAIITFLWFRRKRNGQTVGGKGTGATFPAQEPVLPPQPDLTSPQELASPDAMGSRHDTRGGWPFNVTSSPPAYENEKGIVPPENFAPSELPGSTYMSEHHPAHNRSDTATEQTPRTPTMSPVTSATVSPTVTPRPELQDPRAMSPRMVSPLGSPGIPAAMTKRGKANDWERSQDLTLGA